MLSGWSPFEICIGMICRFSTGSWDIITWNSCWFIMQTTVGDVFSTLHCLDENTINSQTRLWEPFKSDILYCVLLRKRNIERTRIQTTLITNPTNSLHDRSLNMIQACEFLTWDALSRAPQITNKWEKTRWGINSPALSPHKNRRARGQGAEEKIKPAKYYEHFVRRFETTLVHHGGMPAGLACVIVQSLIRLILSTTRGDNYIQMWETAIYPQRCNLEAGCSSELLRDCNPRVDWWWYAQNAWQYSLFFCAAPPGCEPRPHFVCAPVHRSPPSLCSGHSAWAKLAPKDTLNKIRTELTGVLSFVRIATSCCESKVLNPPTWYYGARMHVASQLMRHVSKIFRKSTINHLLLKENLKFKYVTTQQRMTDEILPSVYLLFIISTPGRGQCVTGSLMKY